MVPCVFEPKNNQRLLPFERNDYTGDGRNFANQFWEQIGTKFSRILGISSLSGGYQDLLLGFYQVFTLNSVGISKFQREKSTRNLPENIGKTYKIPIIVIYIQLACEIDIRTLTSHQVFGTRKDGRGGGGQVFWH